MIEALPKLKLIVVTQPNFVAERGDDSIRLSSASARSMYSGSVISVPARPPVGH